jgi:tyrosyl-tRNA synthetase
MNDLLSRGVEELIVAAELEKLLKSKPKLRLKLGVDPSSPDIHLGHAVSLRKLRQLQDQGHTVIFLIGDATARIGDPSGRNKTRPILSETEIMTNAQTYLDQVGRILDVKQCEIRRNSEWFDQLPFSELLKLAGQFTVSQLIEREDFKQRLASGAELGLHELLYPVMQAYDSVMLEADVEFGGSDQRFNMLAGRALQKKMGQVPQQILMTKLIIGTDGKQKMSKSLGNYIGITESASEIYGKVMSIPDELIASYYELATDIDMQTVEEVVATIAAGANPRDAKASLARAIVAQYYDDQAAERAEQQFNQLFRDREQPDDMPQLAIKERGLVDLLVESKVCDSKSAVRRLLSQRGLRLNGTLVENEEVGLKAGDVLQLGKRNFYKLK